MAKQTLKIWQETFAIHSLAETSDIPAKVLASKAFFIGKTADELSIVVPQTVSVPAIETDLDWRVLELLGPLNLSLVGIMAELSNVLAKAKISIFVVSTFDTDFVLVKNMQLAAAKSALVKSGYKFTD